MNTESKKKPTPSQVKKDTARIVTTLLRLGFKKSSTPDVLYLDFPAQYVGENGGHQLVVFVPSPATGYNSWAARVWDKDDTQDFQTNLRGITSQYVHIATPESIVKLAMDKFAQFHHRQGRKAMKAQVREKLHYAFDSIKDLCE